jgi:hypothetical protein
MLTNWHVEIQTAMMQTRRSKIQEGKRQKQGILLRTSRKKKTKTTVWWFALVVLYSSNIPCLRLRFHGEETMSNSSLLGVMRTSCMKEVEIPQGREAWRPTKRSLATVLPNFHTIRYDLQVRLFTDVFCSLADSEGFEFLFHGRGFSIRRGICGIRFSVT